jgi:hypothetical protein
MELLNNRPKERTMNATWIITAFVVIDDLMTALKHKSHPLAQASDTEVLTVAIVAAKYFQNHHERALCVMRECNYLSGQLKHLALQSASACFG